jgi:hypothetical protein
MFISISYFIGYQVYIYGLCHIATQYIIGPERLREKRAGKEKERRERADIGWERKRERDRERESGQRDRAVWLAIREREKKK